MVFQFLHVLGVLVALLLLNELFRRSKWASYAMFGLAPIALIPVWIASAKAFPDVNTWFRWAKLYSVIFACLFYTLFRNTRLGKAKWARWVVSAILCVNIAEACVQDFSTLRIPNIMNALAGVLSVATLFGWREIHTDGSAARDMVWPRMTMLWIVAYDVWNWTFVYGNYTTTHSGYHIAVLLACTIPAFLKRELWLQARAFTLASWCMYFFTFTGFVENPANYVAVPQTGLGMYLAAGLSLALNLWNAVAVLRMKREDRIGGFPHPAEAGIAAAAR